MAGLFILGVSILNFSKAINTKMDFGEDQESSVVNDSSKENEDVEVQHTIVVSTKLKNNNRRGFVNTRDDNVNPVRNSNLKREDSGEVPVNKGYKAVETTQILTPDTRVRLPTNSFNRGHNPIDENDVYPNLGLSPVQFKPSNYYNNVNWWNPGNPRNPNTFITRNDRTFYLNQRSNRNRGNSDEVRDFYCKKCRELSSSQGFRGCEQLRSNLWYESTTPKMKIDGKLAKLK